MMSVAVVAPMSHPSHFSSTASGPSKAQWDALRSVIAESYVSRQCTAKQILMELRMAYGINVTERMLRDRLNKWGLCVKKRRSDTSSQGSTTLTVQSERQNSSLETPSTGFETPSTSFNSVLMAASVASDGIPISPFVLSLDSHDQEETSDLDQESFVVVSHGEVCAIPVPEDEHVSRPNSVHSEDVSRARALKSVDDWFDTFLETAQGTPWDCRECPMLDLMATLQEACYFLDTGSGIQGTQMLREVEGRARFALLSPHPAAFIHLLHGLGSKRLAANQLEAGKATPQCYELAVLLDERVRVIECDGCDAPIVESHYHCKTCKGPCYDLCIPCFNRGASCGQSGHQLMKRILQRGTVVEVAGDPVPSVGSYSELIIGIPLPRPEAAIRYIAKPLMYATSTGTSAGSFAVMCNVLLRYANEELGTCHPMTLLLKMFLNSADWDMMQKHIASIMDDSFLQRIQYGSLVTGCAQAGVSCAWILLHQGRHETLERFFNLMTSANQIFDPAAAAELMRLLATSKKEQGRLTEAKAWLCGGLETLHSCNSGHSRPALKILQDLAYVLWQMEEVSECEMTLQSAREIIQTGVNPSRRDRKYVLTFQNTVLLRLRKNKEAAALRGEYPDVFNT